MSFWEMLKEFTSLRCQIATEACFAFCRLLRSKPQIPEHKLIRMLVIGGKPNTFLYSGLRPNALCEIHHFKAPS